MRHLDDLFRMRLPGTALPFACLAFPAVPGVPAPDGLPDFSCVWHGGGAAAPAPASGGGWAAFVVLLWLAVLLLRLAGARAWREWWWRFSALPILRRIVLTFGVAYAAYVGGIKPGAGQTSGVSGLPGLSGGVSLTLTPLEPSATNRLSDAQYAARFALARVVAGGQGPLPPPEGAVTNRAWALRGGREDTFWIPAGDWTFSMGGVSPVSGVHAAACGALSFGEPVGLARPSPPSGGEAVFAPLWGELDIRPGAGLFWHAVTAGGGLLLTWENAAACGDTGAVVSVQAELFPSGDFACRYAVPPGSAFVPGPAPFTNLFAGAWNLGGGEALAFPEDAPLLCPGGTLELRWRALGALDPGVLDHDGDGLSTYDEVMIHGTDHLSRDTDGDGLWDGEEILTYGTDPLVWDSAETGVSDFWQAHDPASLTNAPWAEAAEGHALVTVTSRLDNASSGVAALRCGGRVIPLLPGTTLVSRVAVPFGETVPVAYVPGPGLAPGAAPAVFLDADAPGAVRDPSGLFRQAAPPAAGAGAELFFARAGVSPGVLCFHGRAPLTVQAESLTPGATVLIGASPSADPPPGEALQAALADIFDPVPEEPGLHQGTFGFFLLCVGPGEGWEALPKAGSVPAHRCVFASSQEEQTAPEDRCCAHGCHPECHTGGCASCDPVTCVCGCGGDPWDVPNPADPATGDPVGVTDRAPRALVIGGEPDDLSVGLPGPGEPFADDCPLCGCVVTNAPGAAVAETWRRTPGLGAAPLTLATGGVFGVRGILPSTNFSCEVFTWRLGGRYSRGRYTVAGVSNFLTSAGGPVTNAPYPRVAAGVPGEMTLWTGVLLPSGEITVEFEGYDVSTLLVWNRAGQTNDVLLSGLVRSKTMDIAEWRERYADSNLNVKAFIVGRLVGQQTLRFGYVGYGDGLEVACEARQTLDICRVRCENVLSEHSGDDIYNPCGIPLGEQGRYKVVIQTPVDVDIPSTNIVWSVRGGDVSIEGPETGAEVTVSGAAAGAFALDVSVRGLDLDPVPTLYGDVLVPVTNSLFVCAVTSNGIPVITAAEVSNRVARLNTVFRQAAMVFRWDGILHTLERPDYFHVTSSVWAVPGLLSYTNGTGGLKLYFVETVDGGNTGGFHTPYGTILAASEDDESGKIIAHEVGHGCGLSDIYASSFGTTLAVEGAFTRERVESEKDWGGGYYANLQHAALLRRLLMYGASDGMEGFDIPRDRVFGLNNQADDLTSAPWQLKMIRVGLKNMNENPEHL